MGCSLEEVLAFSARLSVQWVTKNSMSDSLGQGRIYKNVVLRYESQILDLHAIYAQYKLNYSPMCFSTSQNGSVTQSQKNANLTRIQDAFSTSCYRTKFNQINCTNILF